MTERPIRVQLSRKKGFNLQEMSRAANGLAALKVDRTTPWGNQWEVWRDADGQWFAVRNRSEYHPVKSRQAAIAMAVQRHAGELRARIDSYGTATELLPLRGKNLACWCHLCRAHAAGKPLGAVCPDCDPCHTDVLLELANS